MTKYTPAGREEFDKKRDELVENERFQVKARFSFGFGQILVHGYANVPMPRPQESGASGE